MRWIFPGFAGLTIPYCGINDLVLSSSWSLFMSLMYKLSKSSCRVVVDRNLLWHFFSWLPEKFCLVSSVICFPASVRQFSDCCVVIVLRCVFGWCSGSISFYVPLKFDVFKTLLVVGFRGLANIICWFRILIRSSDCPSKPAFDNNGLLTVSFSNFSSNDESTLSSRAYTAVERCWLCRLIGRICKVAAGWCFCSVVFLLFQVNWCSPFFMARAFVMRCLLLLISVDCSKSFSPCEVWCCSLLFKKLYEVKFCVVDCSCYVGSSLRSSWQCGGLCWGS